MGSHEGPAQSISVPSLVLTALPAEIGIVSPAEVAGEGAGLAPGITRHHTPD